MHHMHMHMCTACALHVHCVRTACTLHVHMHLQVMAIATLAECYRNPKVFTGVVKIRKGLAVRLLRDCAGDDIRKYRWWFAHFAAQMQRTALALPGGKGAVCAARCAVIIELAKGKKTA